MPDRSFLEWPFFEERHRKLAETFSAWAAKHLPSRKSDNVDARCRELVASLAAGGWLWYVAPSGGEGIDARSLCLIREMLAWRSGLADFAFAMQGLGSGPIGFFGSDALRKRYLPKIASGEAIGAFAISEPNAGSDLRAMQMTARTDGDAYILNGTKCWISNAGLATFYVTFCRFPEAGERAFVAVVVDANTPGLSIERCETVAPHPLGTLTFNNCRVPRENLVGKEGEGLKAALATLDVFRASVGAAALGFARRALDEAVKFASERNVMGKPLADFQLTQAKFAEMAVSIDASALLVYRAAWTRDVLKRPVTREAAMAKLHATESAQQVIDEAVQILGARGVVAGSVTEELYREIRALRIYEGTSEIQKLIIAGQVLKAAAAGEASAG